MLTSGANSGESLFDHIADDFIGHQVIDGVALLVVGQAFTCFTLNKVCHWRILCFMIFIETPIFTKRLSELLDDDSYAAFQRELLSRPDMGDVIEGTGGLRKVRVASGGHGKRGGSRVIYYHFSSASQIALLMIYPKNEKDDLSAAERKALKHIVELWR